MTLSQGERAELLKLYADLRVADVRDGMDWMMRHNYGSMSPKIRPLWRTRAVGIAKTVRYLPYRGEVPKMTPAEYTEWSGWYYTEVCPYPWIATIQQGDFCVIDQSGVDAGLMGSNNAMDGLINGATGYVTNGGVRDTDEVILEQIPFWSRIISQSMVQGRLQFDAYDIPVEVGGVLVHPGDMVVADGDGVIVVPQDIARDVAKYAHQEMRADKVSRRQKYEELGLEPDETVL
ncbi:MAG: RraA family protein [Anaerolineae bacterium]